MRKILKRSMALICACSMLLIPCPQKKEETVQAEEKLETVFQGDTFEVKFHVDGKWNDGYNASVTIRNKGKKTIEDWALLYYNEDKIQNLWNGKQIENDYSVTMIKNAEWNQDIKPGESVSFGYTAKYEDEVHIPSSFGLSTCRVKVPEDEYEVTYQVNSDWGSGYSSSMCIRNLTDEVMEDWDLQFDFEHDINHIWNASIAKKADATYHLNNSGYNQNISAKSEMYIGFNGNPGNVKKKPDNFVLHKYTTEIDPELDSDKDELPNIYEICIGTNAYKEDTDGDGLSDFAEVFKLALDPLKKDTDDNGVMDGDEDGDEDQLTNLQEIKLGTEPGDADTDGDEVKDGEEVNGHGTDPLKEDTDGDTLTDGDDLALGFSPLKKDTDDNGVTDDKEKTNQSITEVIDETNGNDGAITGVTVDMKVSGNIENNTTIENVYGEDVMSSELVGLVGVPVDISTEGEFEEATITFTYDPSKLGETSEDDLAIMWYDEENEDYVICDEDTVIDKENHTISYTTDHFSTWLPVNKKTWYNVWRNEVNYYKTERQKPYCDIVFAVDVSGSMAGTEMQNARKAMRGMFNAKRNKDRCNIVKVTKNPELIQNFTNDSDKLKNQLSKIVANGENGADIDKGLNKAIKQYTKNSYTDKGNQKYIVLICDGDMEYNQDIVDKAKKNDIAIITILTAQESEAELKKISDETGGEFYMIDDTTEIADLLFQLQKKTLGELNTKDSDGDGLYDVYEKNGMLCANGKLVVSSARTRHTDVDGISDYDEMKGDKNLDDNGKIKKKKKIRVPGTDEWIEANYFKHRSNPWEKDTDGDEYNDKEDNRPKKKDVKLIEIGRKNYVPIGDEGSTFYGGDQDWWISEDVKFKKRGCGIIAGADVLLYEKRKKNEDFSTIPQSQYKSFVNGIKRDFYVFTIYEITALHIERAMNRYAGKYSLGIKAVPYPFALAKTNRKQFKRLIRQQIKNGYPVIFSAGCKWPDTVKEKNKAKMYEQDREGTYISFTPLENSFMYDHYVSITGVLTDRQKGTLRYQVSSGGKKYYIDYDELCTYMDNYGSDWTCDAIFVYRNQ